MALTPTIKTSQSGALVSSVLSSEDLRVSFGGALAVANFPSDSLEVSTAGAVSVAAVAGSIRVSMAGAMIIGRGRTYNPKLRAWAYTMDAHDLYVLRLAEGKTLVYDLFTEQWSWFTSGELDYWRPNIGMNWYTPGSVPQTYGSNVIVGDDVFGHLWALDPEQPYDDDVLDPDNVSVRFPRVATGQVITRQRISLPVFQSFLTASAGQPFVTGDTVDLQYSDDLGNNYVSAGPIAVTEGDYKQQFSWRSLGLITQSGRLFRIVDDGAFARIDGLDCSIGGA